MKKLLISAISAMVICLNVAAQGDPAVSSVGFASGSVALGQTTTLYVEVTNSDFVNNGTIPAGGYQVSISLPATLVYRAQPLSTSAITHISGPLFNNFDFDGTNVFTADLAAPQGVGVVSRLEIVVKGLILTSTPVLSVVSVTPLTAGVNTTDINANNALTPALQVVIVLPIKLGDISAEVSDCSTKLKWNTLLEEDATSFDVEFSTDARNFSKVTSIAGKKSTSGANYEYSYPQGNGNGYYRLKMSDGSGGYIYSKVVNTNIKCNDKTVSVYPNPVQINQTMRVIVAGFAGKVKGDLISADGKIVSSRVLQNGVNNIVFNNLAQGTYNLKVTDDTNEIQNFKIVVVK
jgi:hypothetical protein